MEAVFLRNDVDKDGKLSKQVSSINSKLVKIIQIQCWQSRTTFSKEGFLKLKESNHEIRFFPNQTFFHMCRSFVRWWATTTIQRRPRTKRRNNLLPGKSQERGFLKIEQSIHYVSPQSIPINDLLIFIFRTNYQMQQWRIKLNWDDICYELFWFYFVFFHNFEIQFVSMLWRVDKCQIKPHLGPK